ncbi:MAG: DUF2513 domain-containing protein [Planctomycetes bacterium]|nr:DUF2513 domain-containing protein [Planctomycetota bacterium]
MKRDLDLARQLLLDIENRGTDCSVSVLRSGSNHQSEEQVRYHLRLLIDAGLLKEIDRTSAGIPCVRLTYDGHELLELARSEPRWREAKYACQERLGGLSLTVIREILLRWAVAATSRPARLRRPPVARRLRYESDLPRERAAYHAEPYRAEPYSVIDRPIERDYWQEDNVRYDNVRYVDVRPEVNGYRERQFRNGIEPRYGVDLDGDGRIDVEYDSTLPGYLI